MLSCSISMLNAFLPHLEHHLIGHLIVALVVSALSCVMLVSLDKVQLGAKRANGGTIKQKDGITVVSTSFLRSFKSLCEEVYIG